MKKIIVQEPLFICAGEPSGDRYGALFVKQLKRGKPKLKICGVGGDCMRKVGVTIVDDYTKLGTFGFSEGFCSFYSNFKMYAAIARRIYQIRPKTFIAVAYPGVNLPLCSYAKRLGCRIFYFLPPQIWAWGSFRKYFVKKWVDSVISIFPFEYEFYKKNGIITDYFENPLCRELRQYRRNDFAKRIGFMPGSRKSQIKRNLPIMIDMMKNVATKQPKMEFVVILHSKEMGNSECIKKALENLKNLLQNNVVIITEKQYQSMKNCDLLIISSGTASLEALFMSIPQVFVNRPSFFDYYIFRHFLNIEEYNLANLYLNKKIVTSIISSRKIHIIRSLREIDLSDYC